MKKGPVPEVTHVEYEHKDKKHEHHAHAHDGKKLEKKASNVKDE